jgi:hypothetical protein
MKKEDMLQTLSFLALRMENSGTQLLEAIAPKFLIHLDPALTCDNRRVSSSITPEFSALEVNDIVKRVKRVGNFLSLTPVGATLMIVVFSRYFQNDSIEWDNIREFFNVKSMVLLPLKKEFDQLVAKKYLLPSGRRSPNFYEVAHSVIESVMMGKKFNPKELEDPSYDRYKFVREISDLIEKRKGDQFSSITLFDKASKVEQQHATMAFVRHVQKLIRGVDERVLFYEICDDYLMQRRHVTDLECTLRDIYDYPSKQFRVGKEFIDNDHQLQNFGLVELRDAEMYSDVSIELTEKGKQIFLEADFDLLSSEKEIGGNKDLIFPDKIAEKTLFYDASLKKQLTLLQNNLTEEKFADLQKRLEAKAMPKGVTALFHGDPGTGKTETAMQIARATGRAVCHVDISAAKTCWYGESQKLVKGIFTKYAKMCEKGKLKPILLFNEADALFSSRQNINKVQEPSSVTQTENAIQNILLEEMEKFDGIMIATTNLADNLDSAFARRFLFKIKFGKPTMEAKQSIWKSKLEWLSNEDSHTLAAKYDFSGGEIDNIVRKITMCEVLDGTRLDLAGIEELCLHEKIGGKETGCIGFKN